MHKVIIYIHGKGGNIEEANHYKNLFEDYDVIGLEYKSDLPWEAKEELEKSFDNISNKYNSIIVIANSIGAYFSMLAFKNKKIEKTFFISPIVDMEKLIIDMMKWENVTLDELKSKGIIKTSFGETLSWEYYLYAKNNLTQCNQNTHILYASKDNLTSLDTISKFAKINNASLTIMEDGEHYFHTKKQMKFLDDWLKLYM